MEEAQDGATCEECETACSCCADDGSASAPTMQVMPLRRRGASFASALPKSVRGAAGLTGQNMGELALLRAEKIDFHVHCTVGDEAGLDSLLRCHRSTGVSKAVLLALRSPQATVDDVRRANDWVLASCARHARELIPFVTILESDKDAATMLREYVHRGAKGLKLIGWTGACIRRFDYDLLGSTMRAVFATAEEFCLPVVVHLYLGIADEDDSAEGDHERQPGTGPSRDFLGELEVLLGAHPKLILVLAHFGLGFDEARLPRLHALLDRFSNLHLDTSLYGGARAKWFGKASRRADALADTVSRFPRQVLFGTDNFGSRQRAEQVYRDAVRISCLHLASSQFSSPELQGASAKADGAASTASGSSGAANSGGRYRRTWTGKSRDGAPVDDRAAAVLHGLDLAKKPALLRAVFFENAARLLSSPG